MVVKTESVVLSEVEGRLERLSVGEGKAELTSSVGPED